MDVSKRQFLGANVRPTPGVQYNAIHITVEGSLGVANTLEAALLSAWGTVPSIRLSCSVLNLQIAFVSFLQQNSSTWLTLYFPVPGRPRST